MNGHRKDRVKRRVSGKQTLFATTAVAAAVIAALHFGMPNHDAYAAIAPVDQNIAPQSVQIAPPSFANLISAVEPAVVSVASTRTMNAAPSMGEQFQFPKGSPFEKFFERRFGNQMPQNGQGPEIHGIGSGFIISPEGYIVTNNHVIAEAGQVAGDITVILNDGSRYKATVIGRDPKTDLALLKIKADKELPYVRFGDSNKAKVGDWVVAAGSPFGLGGSVTAGIISARGRDIHSGPYDDYLQVDAPINRGNSGGPLFDATGRVIGVNTAIYSPSGGSVGIGFAIPSSLAEPVIAQLEHDGHVDRGWLGVQIQGVDEPLAQSLGLNKPEGALVASVEPNSPAERGGFQAGDVIVKFNGEDVKNARELPRMVAASNKDNTVPVEVVRDGKTKTLDVTLGSMPTQNTVAMNAPQSTENGTPKLGLTLSSLSQEAKQRYNLPSDEVGVLVVDVLSGSPADEQGLESGDVITRVDRVKVTNPADVVKEVKRAAQKEQKNVLLLVNRDGMSHFVAVPLSKA